jgi:hypothetical protein
MMRSSASQLGKIVADCYKIMPVGFAFKMRVRGDQLPAGQGHIIVLDE